MNNVFSRSSDIFFPEKVIDMCIHGLSPAINFLFQRLRDMHEKCTYMEIVQQVKLEKDTVRAWMALPSSVPIPKTKPVKQGWSLNMTQYSSESTFGQQISGQKNAEIYLVDD